MRLEERRMPEWRPPLPWQPEPPLAQPPRRILPVVVPPSGEEQLLADLQRRRVVLLAGPLDWESADRAAGQLMLLDGAGPEGVHLYLGCPAGELAAALMLADTIAMMRAELGAVARGVVGGAALAPFAAARRRVALPQSLFELRDPLSSTGEAAAVEPAELLQRQRRQLCGWLARATGRAEADIAADLRSGRVLDAAQAADYGLVHEVLAEPGAPPPVTSGR